MEPGAQMDALYIGEAGASLVMVVEEATPFEE